MVPSLDAPITLALVSNRAYAYLINLQKHATILVRILLMQEKYSPGQVVGVNFLTQKEFKKEYIILLSQRYHYVQRLYST